MIILRIFRKKLAEIMLNSLENSTRPNRRPKIETFIEPTHDLEWDDTVSSVAVPI